VDPTGHSFWKKFFQIVAIVAAVVAIVATAGAAAGIEGALVLAAQAAGIAAGARLTANQLAEASEGIVPSLPSAGTSPTPNSTGTPFIPSTPTLGPLIHPIPKPPNPAPGDPVREPTPILPGDSIPDGPPGGWLIHPMPSENLGQLHNALDVSETPKPSDDAGETPSLGEDQRRNPKQDRRLSKQEIEKLKKAGVDPEGLKGGRNTGPIDLYKDPEGNVYIKPKDGGGPGEPTGINIRQL